MDNNAAELELLRLSADIVSAHVAHNSLSAGGLPDLIRLVHAALSQASSFRDVVEEVAPTPAVPIKKSIFPGYIVCLEDGKRLKMLKRHLASAYGMTPEQYRTRWGLAATYPMVAPEYAARRSELAKTIGLGRKAAPVELAPLLPVTKAKKPRAKKPEPAPAPVAEAAD